MKNQATKKSHTKTKKRKKKNHYKRPDIKKLRYGIIHSQMGFEDGVSIVMGQIEEVMNKNLKVQKSHIFYLVGKAKRPNSRIRQNEIFWHKYKTNVMLNERYHKGLGGEYNEEVEKAIYDAKKEIQKFVEDKKIDVLIVHNSSHPTNFIGSVAISRYYRDMFREKKKPPKYILWWHDSHLERQRYARPPRHIKRYLLDGVPGKYVEYIIFINKIQFENARKYFLELDKECPGFYDRILHNNVVIYNTVTTPINKVDELKEERIHRKTRKFLRDFKIKALLRKHKLKLPEVLFCLQHTRIVPRKRIDFALRYCYELLQAARKKTEKKALYFLVSGNSGDETGDYKKELIKLNKKLSEIYNEKKFFLVFLEDVKTSLNFEQMPFVLRRIGGISTYFSEVEGFGNNLLEVMAAGMVPIVYTYPVFKKDLKKYHFKAIAVEKFEITERSINQAIKIVKNIRMKDEWGRKNIEILKRKLSHETIAAKLKRAIEKKRKLNINNSKKRQ
jgi:hypothetical protein